MSYGRPAVAEGIEGGVYDVHSCSSKEAVLNNGIAKPVDVVEPEGRARSGDKQQTRASADDCLMAPCDASSHINTFNVVSSSTEVNWMRSAYEVPQASGRLKLHLLLGRLKLGQLHRFDSERGAMSSSPDHLDVLC